MCVSDGNTMGKFFLMAYIKWKWQSLILSNITPFMNELVIKCHK